jgi:transposase
VPKWLAKRPRFHVHYTPTYGSWLNLVERWFAPFSELKIKRASSWRSGVARRGT